MYTLRKGQILHFSDNFGRLLRRLNQSPSNYPAQGASSLCTTRPQYSRIRTCASKNVSDIRPWVMRRNPVLIIGRNIPVIATWSPGTACLVSSPLAMMVIERGIWPTGTWSLCSCTFNSWHFRNFEPRVCKYSRPPDLLRRKEIDYWWTSHSCVLRFILGFQPFYMNHSHGSRTQRPPNEIPMKFCLNASLGASMHVTWTTGKGDIQKGHQSCATCPFMPEGGAALSQYSVFIGSSAA